VRPAPASGRLANVSLRKVQLDFAQGVRKIVGVDGGPLPRLPPVLQAKGRAGSGAVSLLHFEADTEGPIFGDGDVLVRRPGPALIRIQRGSEIGSNAERRLASGVRRRWMARTAGEQRDRQPRGNWQLFRRSVAARAIRTAFLRPAARHADRRSSA
jgi:hypothetical protein